MSRKKLIITAIILALVLAIGGILAYFTDVEQKENKFKTSKVDIEVIEESWPGNPDTPGGDPKTVDIVPGQIVAKDPLVKNNGEGTVYAFVEIEVPKAKFKLAGEDAISNTARPLFKLLKGASEAAAVEGINDGWTLLSTDDTAADKVVYVYGYKTASETGVLTGLAKNASTTKAFNYVKFVDVDEDSNTPAANSIQNKEYTVKVNGYGIQTEGLPESATAAEIFALAKGN